MTLNGHFTLNFHYYELTLRVIIYLFTVESVYIHVTSGDVGSGVADRDLHNIWNHKPKCTTAASRSFLATARLSCYTFCTNGNRN